MSDSLLERSVLAAIELLQSSPPQLLSPSDFFQFWSNLNSPVYFSTLLTRLHSEGLTCSPSFSKFLPLALGAPSRHSRIANTIISLVRTNGAPYDRLAASLFSANVTDFFNTALDHRDRSFLNLSSFLLLPLLFDSPTFLSSLLTERHSPPLPIPFTLTIFRFYLTFRTLPFSPHHAPFLKSLSRLFTSAASDLTRRAYILAAAESHVPYGHAALSLFDKLNAGNAAGIIFASKKLATLLDIPVSMALDRKLAVAALVRLSSPRQGTISDDANRFKHLVDRAREIRLELSELKSEPKHGLAAADANYIPPLWQFRAVEAPKIDNSLSAVKYKDVPVFGGCLADHFAPLRNAPEPTEAMIGRGWAFFFVPVIGPPGRMLTVLNSFLCFALSHNATHFLRNLSFIVIARRESTRLTDFLAAVDLCYRLTAAQVGQFLEELTPGVDLNRSECAIPQFPDPENCGNLWNVAVSPYHLLHRFFTFYCDCASVVTNIPIWAVVIQIGASPPFVTGCVSSVEVLDSGRGLGDVKFAPFGLPTWLPIVIRLVHSLTLVNLQLPDEESLKAVADDAMVLRVRSPVESAGPFIVSRLEADWVATPCDLMVDSVLFQGVAKFFVERFTIEGAGVGFPIRTFATLE